MDKKTIMKLAIADSLELLLEKADSLQDISVQDILDQCGLSRPTFYRYFADKYDVVNWSYTYYVEEQTGLYDKAGTSPDEALSLNFVRFFYEKRAYFSKVIDYVGQNSFYDHYHSSLIRWYTTLRPQSARKKNSLSDEERYLLAYIAAGTTQVFQDWLSGGCRETPQQIHDILMQFVPDVLRPTAS